MMKVGEVYKFKKRGTMYLILGVVSMKNPETREWVDAVLYSSLSDENLGKRFVRELSDFKDKFEFVKGEND